MCGIVGIFNLDNEKIDFNELKNFTNSLIHWRPDSQGNYINKAQNIGLGHNRFFEDKVIDLWKDSENKNKATVKNLFIATTQK